VCVRTLRLLSPPLRNAVTSGDASTRCDNTVETELHNDREICVHALTGNTKLRHMSIRYVPTNTSWRVMEPHSRRSNTSNTRRARSLTSPCDKTDRPASAFVLVIGVVYECVSICCARRRRCIR
jgi:hypothetical protein